MDLAHAHILDPIEPDCIEWWRNTPVRYNEVAVPLVDNAWAPLLLSAGSWQAERKPAWDGRAARHQRAASSYLQTVLVIVNDTIAHRVAVCATSRLYDRRNQPALRRQPLSAIEAGRQP